MGISKLTALQQQHFILSAVHSRLAVLAHTNSRLTVLVLVLVLVLVVLVLAHTNECSSLVAHTSK